MLRSLNRSSGFVVEGTHALGQQPEQKPLGPSSSTVTFTPEQERKLVQFVKDQLELQQKTEAIKESKSRRFWGAVGGIAAITTAMVGVFAFIYRDRR